MHSIDQIVCTWGGSNHKQCSLYREKIEVRKKFKTPFSFLVLCSLVHEQSINRGLSCPRFHLLPYVCNVAYHNPLISLILYFLWFSWHGLYMTRCSLNTNVCGFILKNHKRRPRQTLKKINQYIPRFFVFFYLISGKGKRRLHEQ